MAHSPINRTIAKNARATFDYDITQRFVAGVVLAGHEAKSVRHGNVSLKNSFANIMNGELWLNDVHIGPYKNATLVGYEPTRPRKLLVHARELEQLIGAKQAGQNIVVLRIGTSGRYLKVELGLGRGKKKHDKRQTLKKRSQDRDIAEQLKRRQ